MLKRRLRRIVRVYTCQNVKFLEISRTDSYLNTSQNYIPICPCIVLSSYLCSIFLNLLPNPNSLWSGEVRFFHALTSRSFTQSKKEGKDQESIRSSTTPDLGYRWESDNITKRHHKREPRGQPFPSR